MPGEVGVVERVPEGGSVVLAIRNVLQNRGNGLLLSGFRKPDAGGKPTAIRHRNPSVGNCADIVGKFGTDFH